MGSPADNAEWFLGRNGEVLGPLSALELATLARLGHLYPTDYIWNAGLQDWLLADKVPGLLPPQVPVLGFSEALAQRPEPPTPFAEPAQAEEPGTTGTAPLAPSASAQPQASTFLARALERAARRKLTETWAIGGPVAVTAPAE